MNKLDRILLSQFDKYSKDTKNENLLAVIKDDNLRKWYFMIRGLPDLHQDGEYIFSLTAKEDFPKSPPEFMFCTENGIFLVGCKICISPGEFHADSLPGKEGSYGWRPCLGMIGFAEQVVNAFICFKKGDTGIGIDIQDPHIIEKRAKESKKWNAENIPEIRSLFDHQLNYSVTVDDLYDLIFE